VLDILSFIFCFSVIIFAYHYLYRGLSPYFLMQYHMCIFYTWEINPIPSFSLYSIWYLELWFLDKPIYNHVEEDDHPAFSMNAFL